MNTNETDINYMKKLEKILYEYSKISITEGTLQNIKLNFNNVMIKAGNRLVNVGDKTDKLYFVLSGILRSYFIDSNGNDKTHYFLNEGSACCIEGMLIDEPIHTSIEAIEDCFMLSISYTDARKLINKYMELKNIWIYALESSLIYKIKRESSLLTEDATERYINFSREYPNIENRVKQKYIASYLGITPVTLSRIRRKIRNSVNIG